ncbi:MAG: D-alanyl-D-alanine carboxypeptidase family protein [Lachnospiraceae bacterium]|nr:D-alanyl-D-alanine carboxypeptidase family protein [Lachnospiraceae bacterium]
MKHQRRIRFAQPLLCSLLCLFLFFGSQARADSPTEIAEVTVDAKNPLTLESKSYVLMDEATGNILCANQENEELAPASITKIMTLLLIMEALDAGTITYDTMVPVSEHAASMGGSQVYLEPGEELSVHDMLKCICIASANDASVAMAELLAGSEEEFVRRMNERARELSMEHTNFVNCYGLDTEGHYSCAADVARMSRELIRNHPGITAYTTTWMDTIVHHTRKGDTEFGLSNTNRLIRTYSGITGLKTGSTGNALYCLSATATRNEAKLIAVIMGAPSTKVRFAEAAKLLDYGFANYYYYQDHENAEKTFRCPISASMEGEVEGRIVDGFGVLLPTGTDESAIEKTVTYEKGLKAPIDEGEKIGTITYTYQGSTLGESEILAAESVEKASYGDFFGKLLRMFL